MINHQDSGLPLRRWGRGQATSRQMGREPDFNRAQKSCVQAWEYNTYFLTLKSEIEKYLTFSENRLTVCQHLERASRGLERLIPLSEELKL